MISLGWKRRHRADRRMHGIRSWLQRWYTLPTAKPKNFATSAASQSGSFLVAEDVLGWASSFRSWSSVFIFLFQEPRTGLGTGVPIGMSP
jgi:hypothetical protein